ncbi:MAG: hypothetical protein K1X67_10365 [Fimbriimonadaceae bacterium]|nr:hypothetical protein [Fimbriimonadaceae bacterium]
MSYTIDEHRHRFAAWAASRAASVNGCRFTVQQGKAVLERAELHRLLEGTEHLPEPDQIDAAHREWRLRVIEAANAEGLDFTHGVAAKLVNIYLKASYVCGGHHDHDRVRALHPPIDAVLLAELSEQDVGGLRREWKQAMKIRWSNLDSDQYERIIRNLRSSLAGQPLWQAEKYWRGYQ